MPALNKESLNGGNGDFRNTLDQILRKRISLEKDHPEIDFYYRLYKGQLRRNLITIPEMKTLLAAKIIELEAGLDPQPPMQDPYSLAYYADLKTAIGWVAAHYSSKDIYGGQVRELTHLINSHKNRRLLQIDKNKRPFVIDIGCGGGREAPRMSKTFDYLGMDISPAMISISQDTNPGINFQQGDLFHTNLQNHSVDGIFCAAVLHHVLPGALPKALGEFKRVIKDCGIFFCSIREGDGVAFDEKTGLMYFRQREESLIPTLQKAGFQNLDTNRFTSPGGVTYLYNFSMAIPL